MSGAKQLISNEGAIATASPKDRARIAAQLEEENRIRAQAATQGQGGVQSQEQLVAQAKQIAQVSAIATGEEQKKVQLALDELEKANKAKQLEIDKAEDVKRTEVKRASDKAFEAELNDTIRRASYSFELQNNQLRIFPRPSIDLNLFFEYVKKSNKNNILRDRRKNVVTDVMNVPYRNPVYMNINTVGRMWIFKFTLALVREVEAHIRIQYSSLNIQGVCREG